MAAPEYVPVKPMDDVRAYESPPRRPDSWTADRPGDLAEGQPRGTRLGAPGPDQGFAIKIAREVFLPQLSLGAVHGDDAVAGALGVALHRASIFGRAPVGHDLKVAFTVWGFLSPSAPSELVELRERLFAEVAHPHHYVESRRIVDLVPEATLRLTPAEVEARHAADWRSLLDLDQLAAPAEH